MNNEIVSALVLGLIGGVIPGPVLAATFTEILQSGFFKSLRIVFWAMFVEAVVALASLLILSSMGFSEAIFSGISFVGAGILVWIATSIWKVKRIDSEEKVHFGLGKIAVMIMANGVLWTFWITVCVSRAISLSEKIYLGQFLFLMLVEMGWLLSTVVVAIIFSRFRKILSNPKVVPIIFKVFALIFGYFAVDMAYKSIKFFVSQ
ncbi:MAG: LysE family transporter [Parcubacteria group bacterium]|jgi:threonine/homoserine/homoserine lactone efflux protein